uniref:Uncharacterized protein n=1 Tax=Nelumbo nucifera TaxID=4432 RepID=A0A822Y904_NELNU|nr:TPA_asm: hypothetical protein HUJ06_029237 [Nelumbo nucifera]
MVAQHSSSNGATFMLFKSEAKEKFMGPEEDVKLFDHVTRFEVFFHNRQIINPLASSLISIAMDM